MCRAPSPHAVVAALLAACSGAAWATDIGTATGGSLLYGLAGDAAFERSLLAARWGASATSLRLDAAAAVVGPHELRLLGDGALLPVTPQLRSIAGEAAADWSIDPVRATYRYTLLDRPTWAMKLGLSANLADNPVGLRPLPGADRSGFGSLPLLHLAGVAQWSPRWRMGVAVDGTATMRGRALDLGFQVDYLWSESMSVFGGYQLTDAAGEAEGYYGSGLSNRANIGMRYRF